MKQKKRLGATILTVVLSVISVIYVLPVLAVAVNSFKINTFVKTETFALPTAESFAGWDNFITGMTLGGTFWSSVFYSVMITVLSAAIILLSPPALPFFPKESVWLGEYGAYSHHSRHPRCTSPHRYSNDSSSRDAPCRCPRGTSDCRWAAVRSWIWFQ